MSKKKVETHPFDVAEYLADPEEMALYLDACIEESDGDPAFIAKALGDIARAQGMTRLANETGLGRETLYRTLSRDGNPQLGTLLKVSKALGLKIHFKAAA